MIVDPVSDALLVAAVARSRRRSRTSEGHPQAAAARAAVRACFQGQGTITITVSASLKTSSTLFLQAEPDCQRLIPAGKPLSPARQQQIVGASCLSLGFVLAAPQPLDTLSPT
jgi:hypothetical protein